MDSLYKAQEREEYPLQGATVSISVGKAISVRFLTGTISSVYEYNSTEEAFFVS